MTTRAEEIRTLKQTKDFLIALMDASRTKVPLVIRKQSRALLKHYPSDDQIEGCWDLEEPNGD